MIHETATFARHIMYKNIENWIDSKGHISVKSIGKTVGGVSPLIAKFPNTKWEVSNNFVYKDISQLEWGLHPDFNMDNLSLSRLPVDVEALPWNDNSIDIIIADQVLEHVKHPWIAAEEMVRVLKKRGIIICTTTFLVKWHLPAHYFGFTTQGLSVLFNRFLINHEIGSWGNDLANNVLNYQPKTRNMCVPGNRTLEKLANVNDPESAYVVWICGRK